MFKLKIQVFKRKLSRFYSFLTPFFLFSNLPMTRMYYYYYKEDVTMCCAVSLQSRPTLCNPIDGSAPGSPVPGILQARTLEWVAISFSNA